MNFKILNIPHLKSEVKHLRDTCFWSGSNYWTTWQPQIQRDRTKTSIKIAYLTQTQWFAFIFKKYHPQAVQICRNLRQDQKWFYQETINSFLSFSVWCINGEHFDLVYEQLHCLPDVELEFVIPPSTEGLRHCARFDALGLEFHQVGTCL